MLTVQNINHIIFLHILLKIKIRVGNHYTVNYILSHISSKQSLPVIYIATFIPTNCCEGFHFLNTSESICNTVLCLRMYI